MAREAYKMGFPQTGFNQFLFNSLGYTGACALAAVVYNNKVYAANIGDCKGVIASAENGQVTLRKINHKLNANSKKEQQRLRNSFKDHDIFVCRKGSNDACYVKVIF